MKSIFCGRAELKTSFMEVLVLGRYFLFRHDGRSCFLLSLIQWFHHTFAVVLHIIWILEIYSHVNIPLGFFLIFIMFGEVFSIKYKLRDKEVLWEDFALKQPLRLSLNVDFYFRRTFEIKPLSAFWEKSLPCQEALCNTRLFQKFWQHHRGFLEFWKRWNLDKLGCISNGNLHIL